MKKVFINFCLFLAFGTATVAAQTTCPEGGVLINGVCWATRNVDAPGTFAENPEDPGMMYQWNALQHYPAGNDGMQRLYLKPHFSNKMKK